jgi:dihydroceramidase
MQLLDELSMVYTTCIMFYALFSRGESRLNKTLIFLFTASLAIFITGYYHYLKDPSFHQGAFSSLTAFVVFRSMYLMEVKLRPSRRVKPGESGQTGPVHPDQARKDERDIKILRTMWQLVACGVGSVVGGYLIWTLDNEFCPTLRRWRREIGLPWGILLEGHGWW